MSTADKTYSGAYHRITSTSASHGHSSTRLAFRLCVICG
jgi:hypothetical protein